MFTKLDCGVNHMLDLSLVTEQKQSISQKTLQNIEILQMSAQELELYINDLVLENPVMDPEAAPADSHPASDDQTLSFDDYSFTLTRKTDSDESNPGNLIANLQDNRKNSLKEHVRFQLIPHFHNEMDKSVLYFLIESLDERGFLTVSRKELSSIFHISEESADEYFSILQAVQPTGIGAASPVECLLLQLRHSTDKNAGLAQTILKYHAEDFSKNRLSLIAENLSVPVSEVLDALKLIKTLNPIPGNGFSGGSPIEFIQPDIIVVQKHNHFQIILNGRLTNGIPLNENYRQLLNHPNVTVREYLYQKFQQAEWVNKCLEQRNSTLLKITRQIIVNQKDFFLNGPDHLRVFTQAELSRQLNLNNSTVSRAIRQKYLECFWGVYPLKYFFSAKTVDNDFMATNTQIKKKLQQFIREEDKFHPLSDQKIASLFENDGIHIARRTVAKYRTELGIPDTSKRKSFKRK